MWIASVIKLCQPKLLFMPRWRIWVKHCWMGRSQWRIHYVWSALHQCPSILRALGALCSEKNGILPTSRPDIVCRQKLRKSSTWSTMRTKISNFCVDKNHQIWRFLDQSSDMTFTGPSTLPNGEHVRDTWVTNSDQHILAAVRHADGTFSQQSLLANDSVSPGWCSSHVWVGCWWQLSLQVGVRYSSDIDNSWRARWMSSSKGASAHLCLYVGGLYSMALRVVFES